MSSARFLFLTQTYPRFDGDTSGPFIRDLARNLVAAGDRVTVLTPHAPDVQAEWLDDGVEVKSFRYAPESYELMGYSRSLEKDETMKVGAMAVTPLYLLGAYRAVARELRGGRDRGGAYDLIQAHWVVPNGMVAHHFSRRVPVAVGLHGSDVFLAEKPGVRQWARWSLKGVSVLTGCSPELVSRVNAVGFPEEKSRVIPYGVNGELFSPNLERRSIWRDKLGIPEHAPMAVSVGRMATKKGYHVLMEQIDRLMAEHPKLHLVLAGAGDRLEELKGKAAAHAGRVHFPGAVYRDTLPDLYRAADAFILPAVHDPKGNVDGLPNVILEAMATALPVVATEISGIPLAVEDGVNGRLIPEQDAGAAVDALLDVLSDLDRARAWGRAGRQKTSSQLSWQAVAAKYRSAYDLALPGAKRRG